MSRIDQVLPDGVEALTGAQLTAEQNDLIEGDFLGFLRSFLLVFAGVALVVATLSIYNTFFDPGGPADPGVGAVAGPRGVAGPGAGGRWRSRRCWSASSPRRSASRSAWAWRPGCWP